MSELFFAAAMSSLLITVYAIMKRESKNSRYFTVLSLNITFYAIGIYIVSASKTVEEAFVGGAVSFLGQPFVGALWFLYTMDVCEKPIQNKSLVAAIVAFPTVLAALMFTSGYHDILFTKVLYNAGGMLPTMHYDYGVLYYSGLLYTYVFNVISSVIVLLELKNNKKAFRAQYTLHFLSGILMFLVGTFIVLSGSLYHKYAVSFSLCFSQIILSIGLFKLGAFKVVTLARHRIVESMNDGFIVLGKNDVYMDSNRVAKDIFPSLKTTALGTPVQSIPGIPTEKLLSKGLQEFEIISEGKKYYRSSSSDIKEDDTCIGTSIVIYDITEIKDLMGKLQTIASLDALTQVYNRGHFEKMATEKIAIVKRLRVSTCAIMLDIDFFKKINDTYGHFFGDYVLKQIAQEISKRLRVGDLFARYGGEEFCALAFNANADEAVHTFNRLREQIGAMKISMAEQTCSITVSVGVASIDLTMDNPLKTALMNADAALYAAKQSGRNRVCKYEKAPENIVCTS